ncbi:exodeoxyribonuclease VII small subunit [Bradyrhizobium sp. LM2.9]
MAENTQIDISRLTFERAIEELETIVKRLEDGKVPLEESVTIYERGEALKRRCEELLRQAEARVDKITTDASGQAHRHRAARRPVRAPHFKADRLKHPPPRNFSRSHADLPIMRPGSQAGTPRICLRGSAPAPQIRSKRPPSRLKSCRRTGQNWNSSAPATINHSGPPVAPACPVSRPAGWLWPKLWCKAARSVAFCKPCVGTDYRQQELQTADEIGWDGRSRPT